LNLIGNSDQFRETVDLICRLADCDATTIIEGETGTGKEVAARAIHYISRRRDFPFIPVHCGSLPDNLLETELFGHERGAFTDAKERRIGLVAEADHGTLFLDEVEALTPRAQVVLLRFLQDQKYRSVGGRVLCTADLRIIAATNADLFELVERGVFRQDLWFRLRVLELPLPPLRVRRADAVLLAHHFVSRFSQTYDRPVKRLHRDTIAWIDGYSWPGNVRELENVMLREFLLHDGDEIVIHSQAVRRTTAPPPPAMSKPGFDPVFKNAKAKAVTDFERGYLSTLLGKAGGNVSYAARLAHKDRSALNKLIRKHRLLPEQFHSARPDSLEASKKIRSDR
jgi:DNA-binding NtrC family response regulator